MSIHDYLRVKPDSTKLIQGKVESDLRDKTSEKLKQDGVTWDEFLTASCRAYLEGPKKEKRGSK